MKKLYLFLLLTVVLCSGSLFSQSTLSQKRYIKSERVSDKITLDGILSEEAWEKSEFVGDFIQEDPYNGKHSDYDTKVKLIYDDNSIYIGAILSYKNAKPANLLTKRDVFQLTDYFGLFIDPYNDGTTSYGFFTTSEDVQIDQKLLKNDRRDGNWNAIWYNKSKWDGDHLIVEMRIPFSSLRFSSKSSKNWGINFVRMVQHSKEKSTWNFIDKNVNGYSSQFGELRGLSDIDPPLRLSFLPYLSSTIDNTETSSTYKANINYGMDLKLGLNESFTLDMTLIPDFGQVRSDDKIRNLSAFEVYYNEQRPFFTEGTELFNKNGVFYSRRIGRKPKDYGDINDDYEDNIISNPDVVPLLNATKISGKTKKGLGVGVFNAITNSTYAKVIDNGETRKIETEPFTNYNMLVIDQALKNNSNIGFYNTNVYRGNKRYTANVTGGNFRLRDKSNTYGISGNAQISQKYDKDDAPEFGHRFSYDVGKISGKWQFNHWAYFVSKDYDHNDMGYLRRSNVISDGVNLKYNIYEPIGPFLFLSQRVWIYHRMLESPRKYEAITFGYKINATTKKQISLGMEFKFNPYEQDDYFEPRNDGYVFKKPAWHGFSAWMSPDYRKKFIVDVSGGYNYISEFDMFSYRFALKPRWRLSNSIFLIGRTEFVNTDNQYGYVTDFDDSSGDLNIIMGRRSVVNLTNTLELNVSFNSKSSLAFRMRHYWNTVEYDKFFRLHADGDLVTSAYNDNNDETFNAFNIDMSYNWNFAPGSELTLSWKNAVSGDEELARYNYIDNVDNLFREDMLNAFSVKLLYYIDYNRLFRKQS
ncbi:MAG: DUF5916 domain-containing protein [Hyphomicrobiales bacterium]